MSILGVISVFFVFIIYFIFGLILNKDEYVYILSLRLVWF